MPVRMEDLDPSLKAANETYAAIGRFVVNFSTAEHLITSILASLVRPRDAQRFELIARGLDARSKVSRLRAAINLDGDIGPKLAARLDAFENLIKKRNDLVHSWQLMDDDDAKKIHLSSIAKHPYGKLKPPTITRDQIDNYAWWLLLFADDLNQVLATVGKTRIFEIDHPRSGLQPERSRETLLGEFLASSGKPDETRSSATPRGVPSIPPNARAGLSRWPVSRKS